MTSNTTLTRESLTKAWRAAKLPRLYWRQSHPSWRDWERDEVARMIDGVVTVHFYSLEAIREEIEEMT